MTNLTKKSKKRKNRYIRTLAVAAACMTVMITAGTLAGPLKNFFGHSGIEQTDSFRKGTEDTLLTAIDQLDRMFTFQVKAADSKDDSLIPLEEGRPIPIVINNGKTDSWVICSDDTKGSTVNYCISLPQLTCKGDQIKSVTYCINNGAFQIVQPENEESIIVDGQPYDGELNTGSIGGDYSEERGGEPSRPFEIKLYRSITLDYDRQSDAYTWINLCNELPDSQEIIELLWSENKNEESYNNGIKKMLDGTVITCTVNYADNTSQSADIKVDSCIMTRREAGEQLDPEMDPADLEEKTSVITFELQQPEEVSAQ